MDTISTCRPLFIRAFLLVLVAMCMLEANAVNASPYGSNTEDVEIVEVENSIEGEGDYDQMPDKDDVVFYTKFQKFGIVQNPPQVTTLLPSYHSCICIFLPPPEHC